MSEEMTELDAALNAHAQIADRYSQQSTGHGRRGAIAEADKRINPEEHNTFSSLVRARLPIMEEILADPKKSWAAGARLREQTMKNAEAKSSRQS